MTEHDYLNLKMETIEQYSMIVQHKNLPEWKKKGWLAYTEIGLPEGDEEAYMLYGEIKKNEQLIFNRPTLLKQVHKKDIIGLEIINFNSHLGNYGMGGAGFFGLQLSNDEYLTYAVWGAGDYVIIDNNVVTCDPDLYNKTKPWTSNYGDDKTWNFLTEYISGGKITNYEIGIDSCQIMVSNHDTTFTVSFVKNDLRLPRKAGRKRNAYKTGSIEDYILFQHIDGTLIV